MASYVAFPTRNLDDQKPSNSLVNGGESRSTTCEHSWGTTASPQAHIYRVWLKRHSLLAEEPTAGTQFKKHTHTNTHTVSSLASIHHVCPAPLLRTYNIVNVSTWTPVKQVRKTSGCHEVMIWVASYHDHYSYNLLKGLPTRLLHGN